MTIDIQLQALREGRLDEAGQRALLAAALEIGQTDAAFETADHLAYALLTEGRAEEGRQIAQHALAHGEDFALLHTLALAERLLGMPGEAISHLERGLKLLGQPSEDELIGLRADMLEHLGALYRERDQALRAWQALEQASGLHAGLADAAARLRCEIELARLARDMGDKTQSADKWLTVIEVARQAESPGEEARALLELADIAREENHREAEASLRQEAIDALAHAKAWGELARTLFQIGHSQKRRDAAWQALWLMLLLRGPMEGLMNAQAWLFMREDQKARPEAAKTAASVLAVIEALPRDLPRHAENHRMAISQLLTCARLQGIHETGISDWMTKEKLRSEDGVITDTMHMIENMDEVAQWLFDRHACPDLENTPGLYLMENLA